jgi:hypothetical protein
MTPGLPMSNLVARFAGSLRFPKLLLVTALLFIVDVVVPDLLPFADEILLGLVTVILASIRGRSGVREP